MADLMNQAADFSSLETKYKDFQVPCLKVSVGGTDLAADKTIVIASVEAVLSLDSASSVTVRFTNCYNRKNSKFDDAVTGTVTLGKKVLLSLGYASNYTQIFTGYVANIRTTVDVSEGSSIEFTALDARRLMMSDNYSHMAHKIKNYSDAVTTIMNRYSALCSITMDATEENFEDGLIWQRCSDYDFIVKTLIRDGLAEREFFILDDKAYFRKPKSSQSPIMTLSLGKGIQSFTQDANYLNEKIKIMGFDDSTGQTVESEVTAKQTGTQNAIIGEGKFLITDPAVSSTNQAKSKATAMSDRHIAEAQKAELECIGLPELVPGRYVKIDKIDSNINKKYYIKRVEHIYNQEGFITKVTTEGWE